MDKKTALSKGVRTFVFLLAGSAAGWAAIDLANDFKTGATIIGLSVIAALIGGIAAGLLSFTPLTGTNAITRAIATFLQGVGSWFATAVVTDFAVSTLIDFGKGFWRAAVGAALAAVIAFIQNSVENSSATARDATKNTSAEDIA
jgi:hypothetical protein